jgi:hypothetical protein
MFEGRYDQVVCKNIDELIYVNSVLPRKMGCTELTDSFVMTTKFPINVFCMYGMIGWNDSQDRIGTKYSFADFVLWEQSNEKS